MAKDSKSSGAQPQSDAPEQEHDAGAPALSDIERAIEIFEHALGTLAELGGFVLTTANDDEAGALIVHVHGLQRAVDADGYTVFTPRTTAAAVASKS